jgi:hypothetical protein
MSYFDFDEGSRLIFPNEPFGYRHGLAGHPLLTLGSLADLAGRLDRDRVEYNSGKLNIDQRPEDVPLIDMPPAEVVRSIETAGAWMVLKHVETVPEYRALLEACVADAANAAGMSAAEVRDMQEIEGFIFVSSANSTTPFHLDYEQNFFVQLHGDKLMHIFDNLDRSLVSEQQLETAPNKHRNLPYREDFESRARAFPMKPGQGLFLPYTWPHWVKTGSQYSISMAINWKTPAIVRMNKLYAVNAILRRVHLPQPAPGKHKAWDSIKIAAYSAARGMVEPLRQSEGMRRRLRGLFFGRKANYFYGAKPTT